MMIIIKEKQTYLEKARKGKTDLPGQKAKNYIKDQTGADGRSKHAKGRQTYLEQARKGKTDLLGASTQRKDRLTWSKHEKERQTYLEQARKGKTDLPSQRKNKLYKRPNRRGRKEGGREGKKDRKQASKLYRRPNRRGREGEKG